MKESDEVKSAAIIAEYNPFHNGHQYLIDQLRNRGYDHIAAIVSGSFVQRGDIALFSKFDRAEMALACGIDLVAELPVHWALSTANNFAFGGVSIAKNLAADALAFGSECGDLSVLRDTALMIENDDIKEYLRSNLKRGVSFAAARQQAIERVFGANTALQNPNDTLAIEYIASANRLHFEPEFIAIARAGAEHDSDAHSGSFAAASAIRNFIRKGKTEQALTFLPEPCRDIVKRCIAAEHVADITRLETAILAKLRTMPLEAFRSLPDISEGLDNRIYLLSRTATSLEQLYFSIKTKRYPLARIRRIVLSAFLGIDSTQFGRSPGYIRVLAANARGLAMLERARRISDLPIILRTSELKGDPVFACECNATDLFGLACNNPIPCAADFTRGLIKQVSDSTTDES